MSRLYCGYTGAVKAVQSPQPNRVSQRLLDAVLPPQPWRGFAFCPTGEGGGIDNSCSPVNVGDKIRIDGKERDVVNSLGNKIHSTKEGVQNFYRWFGDSRVMDEKNRPLVVYHGTGADFEAFDPKRTSTSPRGASGGLGFYFTANAKEGSDMAPVIRRAAKLSPYIYRSKIRKS